VLSKRRGRGVIPRFFNNYRPQFFLLSAPPMLTGAVELPKGTEMVMPGGQHQDGGDA